MFRDDEGSRTKMLVTCGLIALSVGFGYSMGLNHRLNSPANLLPMAPTTPDALAVVQDAVNQARAAGDEETARWFETVSAEGKDQMMAWAKRRAHYAAGG